MRHARSCPATDGGRCDCEPRFKAQVFDKQTGKRLTKSFATITGARNWRQDAASALRAGKLSADRGPTLKKATDDWLKCAEAGTARNRSGERYKPAALRAYERNLGGRPAGCRRCASGPARAAPAGATRA
jgi:hypothetical protein